jgi:outer membrane lipoprotein-sorting protein
MIRAASALVLFLALAPRQAAPDLLAPTRAAYAALKSYADTGTVVREFGQPRAMASEKHTFRTFYRAPRDFFFEFAKNPSISKERIVVWGDAAAFHTWWSTTQASETYPPGTGASAFTTMGFPTLGSDLQIASLVFPQGGLPGALAEMVEARDAGTESIGGHRCRKLAGKAQSVYPATGHVSNVRQMTLWIDADTQLLRQILEDASDQVSVSRTTTTFDPRANPALDDGVFRFTVPK